MADQVAQQVEHGVIGTLRPLLLQALGEDRGNQVLAWVSNEIRTRPLIAYCNDGKGSDDQWTIGQPSPWSEDKSRIVFAMIHWEERDAVVAYSFQTLDVGGRPAVQFHREFIYEPDYFTGPVSHTALFDDLRAFLVEGSEAERLMQHLRGRLDAKTFERVVDAARDFNEELDDGADPDDDLVEPEGVNGQAE